MYTKIQISSYDIYKHDSYTLDSHVNPFKKKTRLRNFEIVLESFNFLKNYRKPIKLIVLYLFI
jgi:hypothetical protein